jgi:hypothetical protein
MTIMSVDLVWDKEVLEEADRQLRLLLQLYFWHWDSLPEKDQRKSSPNLLPVHYPVPLGHAGVVTTAWRQVQTIAKKHGLFRRNKAGDLIVDAMGILIGLQIKWQHFCHQIDKKPLDTIPLFVGQPDSAKSLVIAYGEHAPKRDDGLQVSLDETDLAAAVAKLQWKSPEQKASELADYREKQEAKKKQRDRRKSLEKKMNGLRKVDTPLEPELTDTVTLNGNG